MSGRERHQASQGRRRPPKRRGGQASQIWRPGRSDHLAPVPSEHACAHHGALSSPQVRPPRGMPSSQSRLPSRWSSTASMRLSRSPVGPVRNIHSRSFPSCMQVLTTTTPPTSPQVRNIHSRSFPSCMQVLTTTPPPTSPQVRNIHSRSFPSKFRSICSSSRIARRRCADCL